MTPLAVVATANRPRAVNPDPLPMGATHQIKGSWICVFDSFFSFSISLCADLSQEPG